MRGAFNVAGDGDAHLVFVVVEGAGHHLVVDVEIVFYFVFHQVVPHLVVLRLVQVALHDVCSIVKHQSSRFQTCFDLLLQLSKVLDFDEVLWRISYKSIIPEMQNYGVGNWRARIGEKVDGRRKWHVPSCGRLPWDRIAVHLQPHFVFSARSFLRKVIEIRK